VTLISPGTLRYQSCVTIPTRHIFELLFEKRADRRQEVAARLYSIFFQSPYTRAAAGYILDAEYHEVLCKGGQWKISSMKANKLGPKNTHWEFEEPDPIHSTSYLRLGFDGHPVTFSMCPLPNNAVYSTLPKKEYVQSSQLLLIDGYYYPSSPSEETLDSFIYEASSKTATIFQATVGGKQSVKQGGIEWLLSLGVEKFRFIAVTAPGMTLNFPFPNQWRTGVVPSIPDKYVLVLDSKSLLT